jgi:predicted ribonuclease YlaK
MLVGPTSQAIARHRGDGLFSPLSTYKNITLEGLSPKDARQRVFAESLIDDNIMLTAAFGPAGTGKTSLAIAYAIQRKVQEGSKIILSKPTTQIGRSQAFGAVPGTAEEKYAPYLASYDIVFRKILGDKAKAYLSVAQQRGELEFVPIELMRGCTFDNATFILDEAQNLDWHELNSAISRMGENTKLILLGDLNQIDIKDSRTDEYLRPEDTGLYQLVQSNAYKVSPITSVVELTRQYRSVITQLVADVDAEIRHSSARGIPTDSFLHLST